MRIQCEGADKGVVSCEAHRDSKWSFRRQQMIETVTRLSDLPKKFAIKDVNKRINIKGGICDATALCLSG